MNKIIHPHSTITLTESWSVLIADFLLNLDRKPSTKETYKKSLKEWVRFVDVEDKIANQNIILQYKQYLIDKGLSAYTISVYLSALKVFFDYLVTIRKIPFNPAQGIRGIKKSKSKRDTLTKDEVLRLLALGFDDTLEGKRNKAILYLKLFTGLRDVSIINADIEDLQVKEGRHILYYRTKGSDSKDSFVVIISEVYRVLDDYLFERDYLDGSEPLFTSLSDRNANSRLSTQSIRLIIRGLFKWASIHRKNIAPHSLRHTAVTMTILGGANIEQAREMAAHSSIETTASYFHDLKRLSDPAEEYIPKYLNVLT